MYSMKLHKFLSKVARPNILIFQATLVRQKKPPWLCQSRMIVNTLDCNNDDAHNGLLHFVSELLECPTATVG